MPRGTLDAKCPQGVQERELDLGTHPRVLELPFLLPVDDDPDLKEHRRDSRVAHDGERCNVHTEFAIEKPAVLAGNRLGVVQRW